MNTSKKNRQGQSLVYSVSHHFEILYFGPLVYIKATSSGDSSQEIVVSKRIVKKKFKQTRDLHHWLGNLPYLERYFLISDQYYKYYVNESTYSYGGGRTENKGILKALQAGDFSRIFKDKIGIDGFLYDAYNNKVFRKFYIDYIMGHITSNSYDLTVAHSLLKKNKQVTKLTRSEVPYYNQDISGEEAIEFQFTPTKEQFDKWTKNDYADSHDLINKIIKSLDIGAAKYAKELSDNSSEFTDD